MDFYSEKIHASPLPTSFIEMAVSQHTAVNEDLLHGLLSEPIEFSSSENDASEDGQSMGHKLRGQDHDPRGHEGHTHSEALLLVHVVKKRLPIFRALRFIATLTGGGLLHEGIHFMDFLLGPAGGLYWSYSCIISENNQEN